MSAFEDYARSWGPADWFVVALAMIPIVKGVISIFAVALAWFAGIAFDLGKGRP